MSFVLGLQKARSAAVLVAEGCTARPRRPARSTRPAYRRCAFRWASCSTKSSVFAASSFATPLVGSLRTTSSSELEWQHSFSPYELRFLRCHRVGKVPLLPGTCYIEFVRVVVVAVHGPKLYSLDGVAFQSIIFLDDDAQLTGAPLVRLQFSSEAVAVSISSKRGSDSWTTHAEMCVRLLSQSTTPGMADVPGMQAACAESVSGSTFYAGTGNDYRGEFRALKEGWARATECLSLVEYAKDET